jgi:hypothetical protein
MLEDDILLIGFHFGAVDEFGQIIKFSMVCEAIAHLRIIDNPTQSVRMIDYWSDIVMEEMQSYRTKPERFIEKSSYNIIKQLQSWKIVVDLYDDKKINESQIESYRNKIIDLLNLFVFYDGNITAQEIKILQDFENELDKYISTRIN